MSTEKVARRQTGLTRDGELEGPMIETVPTEMPETPAETAPMLPPGYEMRQSAVAFFLTADGAPFFVCRKGPAERAGTRNALIGELCEAHQTKVLVSLAERIAYADTRAESDPVEARRFEREAWDLTHYRHLVSRAYVRAADALRREATLTPERRPNVSRRLIHRLTDHQ